MSREALSSDSNNLEPSQEPTALQLALLTAYCNSHFEGQEIAMLSTAIFEGQRLRIEIMRMTSHLYQGGWLEKKPPEPSTLANAGEFIELGKDGTLVGVSFKKRNVADPRRNLFIMISDDGEVFALNNALGYEDITAIDGLENVGPATAETGKIVGRLIETLDSIPPAYRTLRALPESFLVALIQAAQDSVETDEAESPSYAQEDGLNLIPRILSMVIHDEPITNVHLEAHLQLDEATTINISKKPFPQRGDEPDEYSQLIEVAHRSDTAGQAVVSTHCLGLRNNGEWVYECEQVTTAEDNKTSRERIIPTRLADSNDVARILRYLHEYRERMS